MAGPIQVIAPGLLGYFQVKSQGRNPNDLLEAVQPSLEMRDWYFQARTIGEREYFNGTLPTTNVLVTANTGTTQPFIVGTANAVVSPGQLIYVDFMTADVQITTAADTIKGALAMSNQNGQNVVQLGPEVADVVTGHQRIWTCRADRGFWMHSGDKFLLQVLDITSVGGLTVALKFRGTVIPI